MAATVGGQPQVVTFALDDLLARGEPVTEVVVIHPAPGEPRLQHALGLLNAEFVHGLYHNRSCRLQHEVIRHGDVPLATIHDEGTAEATWQTVYAVIGRLKQAGVRLHLCVTGGPRMIGLLAMSAAALHFDHQDRLWHLYTPRPLREAARDGAIMHVAPGAGVRLVPVPMAPWGAYFPALRQLTRVSSGEAIGRRTRVLDAGQRARCREVIDRLTDRQQEVLRSLAAGLTPQEVAERLGVTLKTVDGHKSVILAECRVAWDLPADEHLTYHWLREEFGRHFVGLGG